MHICTRCGTKYDDGHLPSNFTCSCGNAKFTFRGEEVSRERLIREIGETMGWEGKPVDIHSIRVVRDGVYEINLTKLMSSPLIIQIREGKYYIHLPSLFRQGSKYLSPQDLEVKR